MSGLLICFVGVDGTGKTALAKLLVAGMVKKRIPVKYLWFRFPYFFTLAILGVARVLRITRYTRKARYRIVEHNFQFQPLRTLYPVVLFLDALLYYFCKVSVQTRIGFNIVCDRWIPDIIVDTTVDTSNPDLERSWIGRLFKMLASKASFVVFVDASDFILQMRRPETEFDPTTRTRRSLYRSFAQRHKLNTIFSNNPLEVTCKELLNLINKSKLTLNPLDKTYGSSNLWLQPLLKRRFFAIASNWFFQGTLIMTTSELAFRFVLEFAMAASIFAVLSFFVSQTLSVIAGILFAHTINWMMNGNFWILYKFFGRELNPDSIIAFLAKLNSGKYFLQNGVLAIAGFGSLSRGQFRRSSDLDMRIVRQKGFTNWVRANLFMLKLRSTSFLKKIPIDAFLLDKADQIYEHISRNEPPVAIYDPQGVLRTVNDNCILFEDLQLIDSCS